jgi:hypothetical protein
MDFNSNNILDLAITNYGDDDVSVLIGDGIGGFGDRHDYLVRSAPWGIVAGDFNSDNILDLVITSESEGYISVLMGDGMGVFEDRQDYNIGSFLGDIVAGDFNSDNILDLAVINNELFGSEVRVLMGDGVGGFGDSQDYLVGSKPWGIASGDFGSGGENKPPNTPTIYGPTHGKPGKSYTYTFASIDPDGDDIYYYIVNWGEGHNEYIKGPFPSGSQISVGHTWTMQGKYNITVKAEDINCAESEWGKYTVLIPRDIAININKLFFKLFYNHPYLFLIKKYFY